MTVDAATSTGATWRTVHLFVPTVYPNDGIGGHVVRTAEELRSRGTRCEIFVQLVHPETADVCRPVSQLDAMTTDPLRTVSIYQTGTGSTLPAMLAARPEPLVAHHHGLTPIDLLAPWSAEAVAELTLGRRQLEALAQSADMGIGTSSHNAAELDLLGFRRTAVAPVVLRRDIAADAPQAKPNRTSPTVLFVGRVTPNKAHHHLIEAFAVLRSRLPLARLRLVGGDATTSYRRSLDRLVTALGLESAVTFVGNVSDAQLVAEYRNADVFCSMSDHEGFGMPLLEAAGQGLPVVAFDAAAVGETLGRGGILLRTKTPAVVATALERVLLDADLRSRLVAAGHRRVEEMGVVTAIDALEAALTTLYVDLRTTAGSPA